LSSGVPWERTRISYFYSSYSATFVVLPKENNIPLTEATTLDRKSGEAEGSAVPRTTPGNPEWPRGGWCFHEDSVMMVELVGR
jgi:hypothetical protein